MYKIQEKGRPESAAWLVNSETYISNEEGADVVYVGSDSDNVKVLILSKAQDLILQDISASVPITINGQRITHSAPLHHGDEIVIADTHYQLINTQVQQANNDGESRMDLIPKDPKHWQLQTIDGEIKGRVFKLGPQTVIGREPGCNICIPSGQLSRRHVQLIVTGGKIIMQDMNSTNGSFVNGTRSDHRILSEHDELRVGRMTFRLIAPEEKSHLKFDDNDNDKTQMRTALPNINVEIAKQSTAQKLSSTQKNWVTKPTSVGNREDDAIDIILAQHLRTKKIIARVVMALAVCLAVVSAVIFS